MKAFFLGIPEGPGNAEIIDSEIPGPVLIVNPSLLNSSDLLYGAGFPGWPQPF